VVGRFYVQPFFVLKCEKFYIFGLMSTSKPQPVKDIFLSLTKPLEDVIKFGSLELQLVPEYNFNHNVTVQGIVESLPRVESKVSSKLKEKDEVIFSYTVVANRKFLTPDNTFFPVIEADGIQHYKSGKGWTLFARAVQQIISKGWVAYILDEYGDMVDGAGFQGTESEYERWKSQFDFSGVQQFQFENCLHVDGKDYWRCHVDEIFAKITDGKIETVSDRLILKPVDFNVPKEYLAQNGIEVPDSAVSARFQDRGQVVSAPEGSPYQVGEIVGFEPKYCEKYTILDKPYFLIRERRVLGKYFEVNMN
jgi:hypothetical protein